jgi:YegS/Rv2252/BmrU family lipid kinase
MKYIYVVNRFNLKERTEPMIERLKKVSETFNRDYEIIVNSSIEEAVRLKEYLKDKEAVVTAIGGDGSINRILNTIANTKNVLSFIPVGTGNDFYKANLEDLEDGLHTVDIARINDWYFINLVCFGIDADIGNDDSFVHNSFIPPALRYNAGVVYHFLTYTPRRIKVEFADQVIEKNFTTVVVGNAKYYGNGYRVSPEGDITDGKLELLLCDSLNKIKMATTILSMKDASHLKNPAIKIYECERVIVSSDQPIRANVDGEVLESKRFEIEVLPLSQRLDFNREFIDQFKDLK